MKVSILTLSRISTQSGQYYNRQDMGLAKAFRRAGHEVTLYRLTQDGEYESNAAGVKVICIKVRGIRKQSITGFSFIDEETERLICFADNQIMFTALSSWCRKKNILLQPYIGVLSSNSPDRIVKWIMDLLVSINIRQYRTMQVYAKTPDLQRQLKDDKVERTALVPVALDFDLLNDLADLTESGELRRKYGYRPEDKIILYIGRMEPEKEPLTLLSILKKLYQTDDNIRLVMIGNGKLFETVKEEACRNEISHIIRMEKCVENSRIWEYYCMSDCFINLNRHEIYGMSILEALYYNCPVIAIRAPGPAFILERVTPETLCDDIPGIIKCIQEILRRENKACTRKYVEEYFSWDNAVKIFSEDLRTEIT